MLRPALLAVVLLGAGLAGCSHPAAPGPTPTAQPKATFDGAAALGFVKQFALEGNGTPRYRIPATAGQAEGAAMLWNATVVPGWTRSWQNLTGADYLKLDRSMVAGYTPGPGVNRDACSEEDERAVPALPFSNLFVVHPAATAGAPLVVLAAHWDSQMHSDNDPDASRRRLPDPGANDGASGVGVLLQLMRELSGVPLKVGVGLLFLDGEDGFYDCYPLAGSLFFAAHPLQRPSAFVLLDMVGDGQAVYPRESASVQSAPKLVDLLWRHGQALDGKAHFVDSQVSIEDDHLAFIHAGVPSVDLIDAGRPTVFPPQWDTSFDTVDRLDAGMLGLVGKTLLLSLQDPGLANSFGPCSERDRYSVTMSCAATP